MNKTGKRQRIIPNYLPKQSVLLTRKYSQHIQIEIYVTLPMIMNHVIDFDFVRLIGFLDTHAQDP